MNLLNGKGIEQLESMRTHSFCNNMLRLIVMPTEACNFRCSYCYETFEHKKMPREVISGIKALITRRRAELEALSVDWFGGEPLLAMKEITEISRHAIGVANENGITYSSGMTTNAFFLDPQCFRTCLENGVGRYQITLDGDRDTHNLSRKLGSGAGTFDQIWKNLIGIKQTLGEFSILLRLHYTVENYLSIAEFGRKVNDFFGDDERFEFYFVKISRLGGANDDCIALISDQSRKEIEEYLWQASGLRKAKLLTKPLICYAGFGNSLVIRSTGQLAKCTVALSDDHNNIGHIKENGEISINQERFRSWLRPIVEREWQGAKCPLNSVAAT